MTGELIVQRIGADLRVIKADRTMRVSREVVETATPYAWTHGGVFTVHASNGVWKYRLGPLTDWGWHEGSLIEGEVLDLTRDTTGATDDSDGSARP